MSIFSNFIEFHFVEFHSPLNHFSDVRPSISIQRISKQQNITFNMAPKKKPQKKGNDDWEADLGESLDPNIDTAVNAAEPEQNEDLDRSDLSGGGGGGLLAALKKNKSKKQKKGKFVQEDYVDGEDLSAANGLQDHEPENGLEGLAAKLVEEANIEEISAKQSTKPKGGKDKQVKPTEAPKVDEDGSEEDAGGLKTKKEKDKERKEREKQRKKEQVNLVLTHSSVLR